MRGKVITFLGSPSSGKTTLAKRLADHYRAVLLLEEPLDGFPPEIQKALATKTHMFETEVWFRNRLMDLYDRALSVKPGFNVVIDSSPIYQPQFYVGNFDIDDFYKNILYRIGERDAEALPPADCTIYIETNQEMMEKFLEKRKGQWPWEENEEWRKFLLQMPLHCAAIMDKIEHKIPNLVKLKRDEFDLDISGDLERIIGKVDEVLRK